MNEVRRYEDAARLCDAAAELIVAGAARAIAERGRFLLVLAGGGTPRGAYERLAAQYAEQIEWERIHLFWGDERCVPPDDPTSNYGMAAESLLRHVRVPAVNLHRIRGEEPMEAAASRYETELAEFFGARSPGRLVADAAFDLVLLGLGEDGHTASLFPGSPALHATGWAASAQAPPTAAVRDRVTLTFPAINAARECVFLVAGAAKRNAVRKALRRSADADHQADVPAALVRPRGRAVWLLDAEAGNATRG